MNLCECSSEHATGVEEPEIYDGVLYWICNLCGRARVRETPVAYRRRWAEKFVHTWNTARDRA